MRGESRETRARPLASESAFRLLGDATIALPKPFYKRGPVTLYCGDCREIAPRLKRRFGACVTDPPYELGFMGKAWDRSGVAFQPETWEAVSACLLPGAPLLAFGGTRTYHRLTCAIEDAGFEIRDCVQWLYGNGFPKSHDISKAIDKKAGAERGRQQVRATPATRCYAQDEWTKRFGGTRLDATPLTESAENWQGYGTALKPSYEPIVLAMKPIDATFAANALAHGVAGINIDASRIAAEDGAYAANCSGDRGHADNRARRLGFQMGCGSASPSGRWPANTILSHHADCNGACHPECPVRMLDDQAGPQKSGGTPPRRRAAKTKHAYGTFNGQENPNGIGASAGRVSRFFYCAKASRKERGEGNTHPTVKPLAVMRWLIRLVTTPDRLPIVDSFGGSGTTALACIAEGVPCVLVEQDRESCATAKARIETALNAKRKRSPCAA